MPDFEVNPAELDEQAIQVPEIAAMLIPEPEIAESNEAEVFSRQLDSGEIVSGTRAEVARLCPYIGSLPLKLQHSILKAQALGNEKLAQQAAKSADLDDSSRKIDHKIEKSSPAQVPKPETESAVVVQSQAESKSTAIPDALVEAQLRDVKIETATRDDDSALQLSDVLRQEQEKQVFEASIEASPNSYTASIAAQVRAELAESPETVTTSKQTGEINQLAHEVPLAADIATVDSEVRFLPADPVELPLNDNKVVAWEAGQEASFTGEEKLLDPPAAAIIEGGSDSPDLSEYVRGNAVEAPEFAVVVEAPSGPEIEPDTPEAIAELVVLPALPDPVRLSLEQIAARAPDVEFEVIEMQAAQVIAAVAATRELLLDTEAQEPEMLEARSVLAACYEELLREQKIPYDPEAIQAFVEQVIQSLIAEQAGTHEFKLDLSLNARKLLSRIPRAAHPFRVAQFMIYAMLSPAPIA